MSIAPRPVGSRFLKPLEQFQKDEHLLDSQAKEMGSIYNGCQSLIGKLVAGKMIYSHDFSVEKEWKTLSNKLDQEWEILEKKFDQTVEQTIAKASPRREKKLLAAYETIKKKIGKKSSLTKKEFEDWKRLAGLDAPSLDSIEEEWGRLSAEQTLKVQVDKKMNALFKAAHFYADHFDTLIEKKGKDLSMLSWISFKDESQESIEDWVKKELLSLLSEIEEIQENGGVVNWVGNALIATWGVAKNVAGKVKDKVKASPERFIKTYLGKGQKGLTYGLGKLAPETFVETNFKTIIDGAFKSAPGFIQRRIKPYIGNKVKKFTSPRGFKVLSVGIVKALNNVLALHTDRRLPLTSEEKTKWEGEIKELKKQIQEKEKDKTLEGQRELRKLKGELQVQEKEFGERKLLSMDEMKKLELEIDQLKKQGKKPEVKAKEVEYKRRLNLIGEGKFFDMSLVKEGGKSVTEEYKKVVRYKFAGFLSKCIVEPNKQLSQEASDNIFKFLFQKLKGLFKDFSRSILKYALYGVLQYTHFLELSESSKLSKAGDRTDRDHWAMGWMFNLNFVYDQVKIEKFLKNLGIYEFFEMISHHEELFLFRFVEQICDNVDIERIASLPPDNPLQRVENHAKLLKNNLVEKEKELEETLFEIEDIKSGGAKAIKIEQEKLEKERGENTKLSQMLDLLVDPNKERWTLRGEGELKSNFASLKDSQPITKTHIEKLQNSIEKLEKFLSKDSSLKLMLEKVQGLKEPLQALDKEKRAHVLSFAAALQVAKLGRIVEEVKEFAIEGKVDITELEDAFASVQDLLDPESRGPLEIMEAKFEVEKYEKSITDYEKTHKDMIKGMTGYEREVVEMRRQIGSLENRIKMATQVLQEEIKAYDELYHQLGDESDFKKQMDNEQKQIDLLREVIEKDKVKLKRLQQDCETKQDQNNIEKAKMDNKLEVLRKSDRNRRGARSDLAYAKYILDKKMNKWLKEPLGKMIDLKSSEKLLTQLALRREGLDYILGKDLHPQTQIDLTESGQGTIKGRLKVAENRKKQMDLSDEKFQELGSDLKDQLAFRIQKQKTTGVDLSGQIQDYKNRIAFWEESNKLRLRKKELEGRVKPLTEEVKGVKDELKKWRDGLKRAKTAMEMEAKLASLKDKTTEEAFLLKERLAKADESLAKFSFTQKERQQILEERKEVVELDRELNERWKKLAPKVKALKGSTKQKVLANAKSSGLIGAAKGFVFAGGLVNPIAGLFGAIAPSISKFALDASTDPDLLIEAIKDPLIDYFFEKFSLKPGFDNLQKSWDTWARED